MEKLYVNRCKFNYSLTARLYRKKRKIPESCRSKGQKDCQKLDDSVMG